MILHPTQAYTDNLKVSCGPDAVDRRPVRAPTPGNVAGMDLVRPRTTGVATPATAWLPRQHGAWAMLIAPMVVGAAIGPFSAPAVLFVIAWVAAYIAYQDAQSWLRASTAQRPAFVRPLLVYAALAAAPGLALIIWRPGVVAWLAVLAAPVAASLVLVARGAVRSVANDVIAQAIACLSTVILPGLAVAGSLRWPPPGAERGNLWAAAACLFAYFAGTTFYVKTMIRRRNKPGWYVASVAYHAVVCALAFLTPSVWLIVVATVLLARAVAVPRWFRRATPKQIGLGEMALTAVIVVVTILGTRQ